MTTVRALSGVLLLPGCVPERRQVLRAAAALTLAGLAGCGSTGLPPIVWVRLPLDPSSPIPAPALAARAEVIEMLGDLALPGHLDRDAVLVPQGAAVLAPLAGLRWAEPLRDALPRLLRADLAAALGTPVWAAPLPSAVRATRRLRLRLLALDLAEAARSLRVRAEWHWQLAAGASTPPTLHRAEWDEAVARADADGIALAHRAAVAALARRVAASTTP